MRSVSSFVCIAAFGGAGAYSGTALAEPTTQTNAVPPERTAPPAPRPTLSRPRLGGIVLFSTSYGLALASPLASGFSEGREWLAVPAAGPLLGIAVRAPVPPWALALDEIGQVGGILLALAGDRVSWSSTARLSSCPRLGPQSVCASGRF